MVKTAIANFEYILPVIRGIQAGREYYVSMCPVRILPKLFPLDDEEIPPELRASREINLARLPEISQYILKHPTTYIFSAITASIDAEIKFEPIGTEAEERKIGRLRVPMDARFSINDGKHRRAALELALKENPDLGYETIALILFLDIGLKRSQQIFSDLNRFPVVTDSSLNILYDQHDRIAELVREVVQQVTVFRCLTDTEHSVLSARSGKLFTIDRIYNATINLLVNCQHLPLSQQLDLAVRFWNIFSDNIPDWQQVLSKKVAAGEVRRDYVHCHPVALLALGEVGAFLLSLDGWEGYLQGLKEIDWSRFNGDWQGRILVKGGFSKSRDSVSWLRGYILQCLGLGEK